LVAPLLADRKTIRVFPAFDDTECSRLAALERRFADPDWNYGENPPFWVEAHARFAWGSIEFLIPLCSLSSFVVKYSSHVLKPIYALTDFSYIILKQETT
jgi:hypothetical protein